MQKIKVTILDQEQTTIVVHEELPRLSYEEYVKVNFWVLLNYV